MSVAPSIAPGKELTKAVVAVRFSNCRNCRAIFATLRLACASSFGASRAAGYYKQRRAGCCCCCVTFTLLPFIGYLIVVQIGANMWFGLPEGCETCLFDPESESYMGDATGNGNSLHEWRAEVGDYNAHIDAQGLSDGKQAILSDGHTGDTWLFDAPAWTYMTAGNYTTVELTSRDDGVELSGWLSVQPGTTELAFGPDAPVVLLLHGYSVCKRKYEVLFPANQLWDAGFNVLLIDARNHGDSGPGEPELITWGVNEHLDVLGGWDWLQTEYGIPARNIGIFGSSMGGGTALIAMGNEPALRASFVDGPVCMPKQVLAHGTDKSFPFLAWISGTIADSIYAFASGWDAMKNTNLYTFPADKVGEIGDDQHLFFVTTTGDETVLALNAETCHANAAAACAAGAGSAEIRVFDDRDDFASGEANGPSYTFDTTGGFDTHIYSMLYYPEQYTEHLLDFYCSKLDGAEEARGCDGRVVG